VLPLAVPRAMLNLFSQFNNLPDYSSVGDPFGLGQFPNPSQLQLLDFYNL